MYRITFDHIIKDCFQGLAGFSPAFSVLPIFSPAEGFFLFRWIKLYYGKESPLKRKFAKNNYLLNQKKKFLCVLLKIKRNFFGN
uniref:Uncharacterized protein n=1 Tax=Siphoviridae sp. ctHMI2 TaxID=2826231 RepID=A0A8S5MK57_9CAUD|nr:MAG TPA: hypothetical protein [Siphoviridae sp. ctHMI2]